MVVAYPPRRFGDEVRSRSQGGFCFFWSPAVRTIAYVDGFNLYYGALKGTPYRWLDLAALLKALVPKNKIERIRYFTAKVAARPTDPTQPVRQSAYLRALKTLPNLDIHLGHFLASQKMMPLAQPTAVGTRCVEVISTEEKGSDVNLASWLLIDGFTDAFEVAIVISNDSDLAFPIGYVAKTMKRPVIVLNPRPSKPSVQLSKVATFVKPIRTGVLASGQFSPTLTDSFGTFTRPAGW